MFSPKKFRRSTLSRRRTSSRHRCPRLGAEQLEKRTTLSVSPTLLLYSRFKALALCPADVTPPEIRSVGAPTPRVYAEGNKLAFRVNFTEDVVATGTPTLPIKIGDTVRPAVWNGRSSGSKVLTFSLVVQSGDFAPEGVRVAGPIVLPEGSAIRDKAGNDLDPAASGLFRRARVDVIPPSVMEFGQVAIAGNRVSMRVKYTSPVLVRGQLSIPFTLDGAPRQLVYVQGLSARNVLTFAYKARRGEVITAENVALTNPVINFKRGQITDLHGNPYRHQSETLSGKLGASFGETENARRVAAATSAQKQVTIVIRHGTDNPPPAGQRQSGWDDNLRAATTTNGRITTTWLDNNAIRPQALEPASLLGLNPDPGTVQLIPLGFTEADSYKTVLPALLNSLNAAPISRIMADSYARPRGPGTPNPLDTVLPLIIDTVTDAPGKNGRPLNIDLVVNTGFPPGQGKVVSDSDAWTKNTNQTNPIIERLMPLLPHPDVDRGDAGSVLVVSTVQGLWDTQKKKLKPDSILGQLNAEYHLDKQLNYLNTPGWFYNGNWVSFDKVEPQKGTTIYVYGELDGEENNGFEVYVYSQNFENKSWTSLTKDVPDMSVH